MSSEIESESNELLSVLLDGEIAGPELDRLLQILDKSDAARARWQRLCMVRAVQEGIRVEPQRDICAGVMAALVDAPIPARDERIVPLPQRPRSVRQDRPARGQPAQSRTWRPVWGAAAVASMAVIAVAGAMRLHVPAGAATDVAAIAQATAANDAAHAAAAEAVNTPDTDVARLDPAAMRQLDDYVIEHSNYRTSGMGGSLGYARVAAHTAEYQPDDGQR